MTLPRYAIVLNDDTEEGKNNTADDTVLFQALSQLDARDPNILHDFMEAHRNVRIKVLGLSDSIRFHENLEDSPDFEEFSVDLWKEYYIQEGIIQIGVLEDKEPTEGLFVGATSGRVYVCGQADDFSQQKCVCVSPSLYQLIWKGPEQPVQYKAACMMDGCYGCFDPVMRHRLFRHKQF